MAESPEAQAELEEPICALRGDSAGDALSMNSLLPGGAEEQLPQSRCASAQGQGGTALREGHRRGRAV